MTKNRGSRSRTRCEEKAVGEGELAEGNVWKAHKPQSYKTTLRYPAPKGTLRRHAQLLGTSCLIDRLFDCAPSAQTPF